MASRISADSKKIHLVHGNHLKPAFEILDYETLDKVTCLVRGIDTKMPGKDYGIKYMVRETVVFSGKSHI